MEACLWIRLILSLPVFNQTSSGFGSILIAIPIFTLFRNIKINISGGYGSVGWGMFPERIRIQTLLAVNAFINGLAFLAIHRVVLLTQGRFRAIAVLFSLAARCTVRHLVGGCRCSMSLGGTSSAEYQWAVL